MSDVPARLRGAAAGLLTATLTLAAHSAGGGGLPAGAAAGHLLVVAAVVAAVAMSTSRAAYPRVVFCILAAGQLIGHGVLSAQGHLHATAAASSTWLMPVAHLAAIALGAMLITTGERLCRALVRTVRRVVRQRVPPVAVSRHPAPADAVHPMQSTLQLACSISHRGPPAGATC